MIVGVVLMVTVVETGGDMRRCAVLFVCDYVVVAVVICVGLVEIMMVNLRC